MPIQVIDRKTRVTTVKQWCWQSKPKKGTIETNNSSLLSLTLMMLLLSRTPLPSTTPRISQGDPLTSRQRVTTQLFTKMKDCCNSREACISSMTNREVSLCPTNTWDKFIALAQVQWCKSPKLSHWMYHVTTIMGISTLLKQAHCMLSASNTIRQANLWTVDKLEVGPSKAIW